MKKQDLHIGLKVCHRTHGTHYRVESVKCCFKQPETGEWVDGVLYAPLYDNPYECFMREYESFLEEFDVVEDPATASLRHCANLACPNNCYDPEPDENGNVMPISEAVCSGSMCEFGAWTSVPPKWAPINQQKP